MTVTAYSGSGHEGASAHTAHPGPCVSHSCRFTRRLPTQPQSGELQRKRLTVTNMLMSKSTKRRGTRIAGLLQRGHAHPGEE